MNDDIFLKNFGLSLDEINGMKTRASEQALSDRARFSRLNTTRRTADAGKQISTDVAACKRILSMAGFYIRIDMVRKLVSDKQARSENWDELLERVLLDPVSFRDPTIWLLFHAAMQAERDFALDACPTHSREDVLTGRFIESIRGACAAWAETSRPYLNRTDNLLELSSIDLTVDGGEQVTGADFALILDIRENAPMPPLSPELITLGGPPRGPIFVPLLFQAKCYTGTSADISRKHKTRGYQFNRLRQTACASNYIFYENGKDRIDYPALPMVKPSSLCAPVEMSAKTAVFEKSANFSTYLLKAINGFDEIPSAGTREDALNMILANISPDSVTRIAILGNTEGLDAIYSEALTQLQSEIDSEIAPETTDKEPPSEDETSNDFHM